MIDEDQLRNGISVIRSLKEKRAVSQSGRDAAGLDNYLKPLPTELFYCKFMR